MTAAPLPGPLSAAHCMLPTPGCGALGMCWIFRRAEPHLDVAKWRHEEASSPSAGFFMLA